MIDATRIETPEVERPDLYGAVTREDGRWWPVGGVYDTKANADHDCAGYDVIQFRLPGTRREKLTKALMLALQNWKTAHSCFPSLSTTVQAADAELHAAYAALLALDAEGVKG